MEFRNIKKISCGNYLNRYDICYMTPDGGEKIYEMFSRDGAIDCADKLKHPRTDAVVMIVTDREGDHMLLIREFRLELNRTIYGVPAGLIDPGETPEEAAVRELKEETGLDMVKIRDVMPPSYSAVGLSNEKGICVIGVADGEIAPNKETGEEITAEWYTRAQLRELLKQETFGAWSQAYTYMWAKGL